MSKIRIAVADENVEYLERLVYAFQDYPDLELVSYTDSGALNHAIQIKHFDILLCTPSIYLSLGAVSVSTVLLLIDNVYQLNSSLQGMTTVNKYQRVRNIYSAILDSFAMSHASVGQGNGNSQIIAVFSPVGGSGKTAIALASAVRLAMSGKRTLFLSFEEFNSYGWYLPVQEGEKGISELMACLDEDIDFNMKVRSMLHQSAENLFYFNPFQNPNDILAMTEEDIDNILSRLRQTGLFDCIVLDMDSSICKNSQKIFEIAGQIVVVACPGDSAAVKINGFFQQAFLQNQYGFKFRLVMNKDNGRSAGYQGNVDRICQIFDYGSIGGAGLIDRISSQMDGNYVSALLQ